MIDATDDRLRGHIDAIENLLEEKRSITEDINERYKFAKSEGYDTKILRQVIRLRKLRDDERQEMQAVLDAYMCALGMV